MASVARTLAEVLDAMQGAALTAEDLLEDESEDRQMIAEELIGDVIRLVQDARIASESGVDRV